MWLFPISAIAIPGLLAIPLSIYLAWIMDGRYRPPKLLKWFEDRVNSGPMTWKQYAVGLLAFNVVLYIFGFLVLSLQPWVPLNPRGLGAAGPEHDLQHRYFFHHQYRYSALFWRCRFLQFHTDILLPTDVLSFCRDRFLRTDRDHPRLPQ